MAHAIHIPRLNNNDDQVRLTDLLVRPGDRVAVGQPLAQIETDKATVAIESDREGYVLVVQVETNAMVPVGALLLWIGETPGDEVPRSEKPVSGLVRENALVEPTAKARASAWFPVPGFPVPGLSVPVGLAAFTAPSAEGAGSPVVSLSCARRSGLTQMRIA